MGILGQNESPFLCDRIFDIFDEDKDSNLSFQEFSYIMDILCNGSEVQRYQFSFRLMDTKDRGYINCIEFQNYFTNVVKHWSSLVNKQIKLQKDLI
jgi:Ca2+-binding EF-hand superfamily protein